MLVETPGARRRLETTGKPEPAGKEWGEQPVGEGYIFVEIELYFR